jgi:hypothetical protein
MKRRVLLTIALLLTFLAVGLGSHFKPAMADPEPPPIFPPPR